MIVCSVLLFYFWSTIVKCNEISNNTGMLIIDNDAGGDDAVAIFLALLNEKYFNGPRLIGLTTVKGNTLESNVNINNQRILRVAKRQDVPIYRGSTESLLKQIESVFYYGNDGMGDFEENLTGLIPAQEKNAVSALIELSKQYEGQLSVVTLGPLTNIAIALRLDPDFIGRLAHLYIGGGHIHTQDYPKAEFNVRFDVEAYHIVLEHSNPDKVTILPFSQVKTHLNISKSWRQDVFGAIDNDVVKAINKYEEVSMKKNEEWTDLDPAVVAIAVKTDLVKEYAYSRNNIILNGDKRGVVTNEFVSKDQANARIASVLKKEEYVQFLMNVFLGDK